MKRLLFLICLPLELFCQNTIGLPDVLNYSKQVYSAGLQNWDIKQDNNGILYIANNEGLLTFDGKSWNLYPLPNKTIVRSIEIGVDGKVFAGGQDEMGYFLPGKNGQLHYTSLTQFISQNDKSFGDVWDIVSFNKNVFFRTNHKIFKFSNEAVSTYNAPFQWEYLGICTGRLYAHDSKTGLSLFENEKWEPLKVKNELPENDPVTGVLPIHKDSALITTLSNGLFILSKTGISKLASPITSY